MRQTRRFKAAKAKYRAGEGEEKAIYSQILNPKYEILKKFQD
jgi:hypothetical protein